jgi:hypothetical protein
MAKLKEKKPFDFSPRGGTIHEFGECYVTEIAELYRLLNELRENKEGIEEPQAHQIKISDQGKLYIRNTDNSAWTYIGEVNKENLGLKEIGFIDKTDLGFTAAEADGEKNTLAVNISGNAAQIANVLIAVTNALADGEALVYNSNTQRFTNQKVAVIDPVTGTINVDTTGSAGKIGDKPVLSTNIQDGEILVYRPSLGGFVNETKATGVGAKEISFVINTDILLGAYSGIATANISLLATSETEPTDTDATKPPVWVPVKSTSE